MAITTWLEDSVKDLRHTRGFCVRPDRFQQGGGARRRLHEKAAVMMVSGDFFSGLGVNPV